MDPKSCKSKLLYINPPKNIVPQIEFYETYIYYNTPTIKYKI